MVLSDQELLQIDDTFIDGLLKKDPAALARLSLTLVNDLKEARERLNQNPSNSSKPSGSVPPWDKGAPDDDEAFDLDENGAPGSVPDSEEITQAADTPDEKKEWDAGSNPGEPDQSKRKPGRQLGSQGFGRTQTLPVTRIERHHCGCCSVCHDDLLAAEKAYTGFYSINVEFGDATSPGLQLTNTHHIYYSATCPSCGLENRSQPWRAPLDSSWGNVGMTEWRLIGPDLAAMIVYLSMDMRITRRRVQLFLHDILGLELCIGSIQNCMVESARALAPVEEQLIDELLSESLLHADETSQNEAGKRLWLWVFITATTALFLIGRRTKDIFIQLIASSERQFDGWLMSDGYRVYRSYLKRLRCWAHLTRKAKGLSESYTAASRHYGKQIGDSLGRLMDAIYRAREGPDKGKVSITTEHQSELNRLRELCEAMSASSHKKTRELGKEFLNDWDAIFRVLDYPAWPLTNNEAERALRHWVILRRITQGTRSAQGSRALALFASVIETCRLRKVSPLLYIRDVITLRRQGKDAPKLPVMPALTLTEEGGG